MTAGSEHIPAFIQAISPVIDRYGYLGVGSLLFLEDFGIPVPGESILIAAAFFAGLGQLNIFLVLIIGFFGAVLGDNVGFAIGHFGGHPLVERYGKYVFMTPKRIATMEAFFNRQGGKIVIVARFIEGLRQLNGIIAGFSEMRWKKFLVFNMIGAALWVGFWSAVGYFGGEHIETFLHYQLYFSLSALAALILYGIYRAFKRKNERAADSA